MEKRMTAWEGINEVKNGLVRKIKETIGERTLDVSKDNVNVFAIDHHCGEGINGRLCEMSSEGFTIDFDGIRLVWKGMIVEDLAMVYDYLLTGEW